MTELNLYTWFSQRELPYCPQHFVVVDNIISIESKQWILEKLTGRFCLVEVPNWYDNPEFSNPWKFGYFPAFENPLEATYFQLVWS
jgi:hypothetical protein